MLNSFLSSQHIKHDRISTVKHQFSLIKFQFHAEMPISIKTCYIGNHPRLQIGTKIHGQEQLW